MPTIFKLMQYRFFFWSNEGVPTEPVHIHFTEVNPSADSLKIFASVRDNRDMILREWIERFGELSYKDEQH